MKTRRATPADAEEISALLHKLSHHFLACPSGPEAEAFFTATSTERMAQYIAEESRVYVVAHDAKGLAGFISLKGGTRISQFFVEPRSQGQGLGRKLWNEVRLMAGARDSTEFTVDSSHNAVAVYESFGFTASGPATQEGGVVFVPMHKAARTP